MGPHTLDSHDLLLGDLFDRLAAGRLIDPPQRWRSSAQITRDLAHERRFAWLTGRRA